MKKTFRIGERAYGGIIKVDIINGGKTVVAGCYDWFTGKLVEPFEIATSSKRDLVVELCEFTDSYHADMIMDWVNKNAKLDEGSW